MQKVFRTIIALLCLGSLTSCSLLGGASSLVGTAMKVPGKVLNTAGAVTGVGR